MTNDSQNIAAFWEVFSKNSAALASIQSAENPIYDVILEQLHQIHKDVYFMFSTSPGNNEAIITAEGNLALFSLVDKIVAQAPVIPGWTLLALVPKHGFPKTAGAEGLTVKMDHIVFHPLEREGSTDLGFRILVPGLKEKDIDKCSLAILRAIDHGVGERKYAESVRYTEIVPLPKGLKKNEGLPIFHLENYIDWWNSKRRNIDPISK